MRMQSHNIYSACASACLIRFLGEIWLFHLEDGTIPPYCMLQFLPFISKAVNHLCIAIVFVLNKILVKYEIFLFTCMP